MRLRTDRFNSNSRLLSETDLQSYLSVGRVKARQIGQECGARIKLGKRVLYDKSKIDAAIDAMLEKG